LEDVLSGGVAEALARTAGQIRDEVEALDAYAEPIRRQLGESAELDVDVLAAQPTAVRRRLLRWWLAGRGAGPLTATHLSAVDALVTDWRGQGPVDLPRGVSAVRRHGRL